MGESFSMLMGSPLDVFTQAITQPDGQAIHGERHGHEDGAGSSSVMLKGGFRTRSPVEDLDRHDREGCR